VASKNIQEIGVKEMTMRVTYFEYPSRGSVFAIDKDERALRKGRIVQLPDGHLIKVTVREGYFPNIDELEGNSEGEIIPARLVIAENNFQQSFEGDWNPLITCINAAAAVNTLFTVVLTAEDYERLANGGFTQLKKKLSPRAKSLIRLEEDSWNGVGAALELLRTGRCP
jgi:hypothetical protein